MTRALLQQALDAFETDDFMKKLQAAIDIRAELAKPEQKPFFQFRECEDSQAGHPEQAIHPDNCIWRRNGHKACTTAQLAQEPTTYSSTQATNCAGCGKHKHTPLRIDAMGGYVCLTCIDQKLGSLLGEFGYPEPPAQPAQEPTTAVSLQCAHCQVTIEQLNDKVMYLMAQPAQEPRPPNCGTGHCSCIECHDPAYRAMVRGEAQPAQDGVWYRVVDEALVCAHIGVANITDDYATAQKKLNELICWSIQVDRDLARPAQEPPTYPHKAYGIRQDGTIGQETPDNGIGGKA
jgi:hypothetical protein